MFGRGKIGHLRKYVTTHNVQPCNEGPSGSGHEVFENPEEIKTTEPYLLDTLKT
jgi:hypothetical protein